MRQAARYMVWTLGSAAYWAAALSLTLFASWVVGGDCGLERTDAGLFACGQEKRWAVITCVVAFAIVYIAGVRAVMKRSR